MCPSAVSGATRSYSFARADVHASAYVAPNLGATAADAAAAASAAAAAAPASLRLHSSNFGDGGFCDADFPASTIHRYRYDAPSKWLPAHNYYRACHGAPPLVWNESLVALAKEWADILVRRCRGVQDTYSWVMMDAEHRESRPHDPHCFAESFGQGENILTQEATTMNSGMEMHAVETWYREVETECPAQGNTHGCGDVLNHYTTMMWKSMAQVRERETETGRDRQRQAETDRDRQRQTGRDRQRQAETETETDRQRQTDRDRQAETDRDRQAETDRDRRQRQTETDRQRQTGRDRDA